MNSPLGVGGGEARGWGFKRPTLTQRAGARYDNVALMRTIYASAVFAAVHGYLEKVQTRVGAGAVNVEVLVPIAHGA